MKDPNVTALILCVPFPTLTKRIVLTSAVTDRYTTWNFPSVCGIHVEALVPQKQNWIVFIFIKFNVAVNLRNMHEFHWNCISPNGFCSPTHLPLALIYTHAHTHTHTHTHTQSINIYPTQKAILPLFKWKRVCLWDSEVSTVHLLRLIGSWVSKIYGRIVPTIAANLVKSSLTNSEISLAGGQCLI